MVVLGGGAVSYERGAPIGLMVYHERRGCQLFFDPFERRAQVGP